MKRKRALLRIAPVATNDDLLNAENVRHHELYDRHALKPLLDRPVKVLASHNDDEEIGVVKELFVEKDAGGGEWHWALAEIHSPPEWLRPGLGCSISFAQLRAMDMGGWNRVMRATLNEISILRPSESPAHPRAKVVTVSDVDEALKPGRRRRTRFSNEEIRRRIEAAEATGVRGAVEAEVAYMRGVEERAG